MKHILNNLTEKEKNAIREQHSGGMKIELGKFKQMVETKLGDPKPFLSEQLVGTVVSNPMDWFKQFPCIMNNKRDVKMSGNKAIFQGKVLLPETGYNDGSYERALSHKPYKGVVGKVQGGGCYLCDSKNPEFLITI